MSVSGRAHVVDDMAKKSELFNKFVEAWFPGGVTDPDLALVAVDITHAEYWETKDNQLVQLFKMATAAVTGTPPKNVGERGEIRMS